MSDNSSSRFYVQSPTIENSEFVNRQKSVFCKLDAVVKDNEKSIQAQNSSKRPIDVGLPTQENKCKKQRYDTRQFRGQESIFKRPEPPPPSRFVKTIPDYLKNPWKWTKYTLGDVSQEDMSDRSNTAAAMSFLRELKARKESEHMDVDTEVKQITFTRPSRSIREEVVETSSESKFESPSFKSSKVIMPEYVVGKKKVSRKALVKPLEKAEKSKEIKLDHLSEENEDI